MMGIKNTGAMRMLLFASVLLTLFAGNSFAVCSGNLNDNCGGFTQITQCNVGPWGGCNGAQPSYCVEVYAGDITCGVVVSQPTYNCALDPFLSCSIVTDPSTCTDWGCTWTPDCSNAGQPCGGANPECCSGLECSGTNTCQAPPPPPPACGVTGDDCGGANPDCCSGLGLTCTGGKCQTAPSPISTTVICRSDQFNGILQLCAIGGLAMAALVATVYMLGQFFGNARMLMWAKTETLQLFASLVIAGMLIFVVSLFCSLEIGEVKDMFGAATPLVFKGNEMRNFYDGAIMYLENLGGIGLANMASLRYNLGAYEIRTSYQEFDCMGECVYSLASTNVAKYGGETMQIAITNSLLGTATVSYLTTIFQYFTLQYIYSGLFIVFLPLSIVIRSIPYMRNFGGALMAIIVALYIMYPAMVVVDAYLAPALAAGSPASLTLRTQGGSCDHTGKEVFGLDNSGSPSYSVSCNPGSIREDQLGGRGIHSEDMEEIDPDKDAPGHDALGNSIKLNVLIFLASVFLPAINFVVIAAFGRELSRFLGEEADISRLGQMV